MEYIAPESMPSQKQDSLRKDFALSIYLWLVFIQELPCGLEPNVDIKKIK